MAKRPVVTLTTDFGTRDPYVAAMKGVILCACPTAEIIDVSHEIPSHDVLAGAFVLAQASPYFPPGTLHVGVVDPGVGTDRRILAGRFGEQFYLVPDNGLVTFVSRIAPPDEIISVSNTRYLSAASTASMTFHGRDVFAPIAGHILNGVELRQLGPRPRGFQALDILPARVEMGELVGRVIYADGFGNLVSNISTAAVREFAKNLESARVSCAGREVGGLTGTYGFAKHGELLALFNSTGLLEVAVNCGRASDALNAGVGAEVRVTLK